MSTIRKEGVVIIAGKRKLNSFQFNALAIILVLVGLPFATAIISDLGNSTSEDWEDSMEVSNFGVANTGSIWTDNGGDNFTYFYKTLIPSLTPLEEDCAYIKDGFCQGLYDPPVHQAPVSTTYFGNGFALPMVSQNMQQSHYYVSNGSAYPGLSGDKIYGWELNSQFFPNLKDNTSISGLSFTMVDKSVNYAEGAFNESLISFFGDIVLTYDANELKFENYLFEITNEYCFFDPLVRNPGISCYVGFQLDFDFTNFESLEIFEFNQGNWSGTKIKVLLKDFQNDEYPNFGGTPLPFTGEDDFQFGMEHQTINPREAGFLVKGGTTILSGLVLLVGIASTPYWDPFKQAFRGVQ